MGVRDETMSSAKNQGILTGSKQKQDLMLIISFKKDWPATRKGVRGYDHSSCEFVSSAPRPRELAFYSPRWWKASWTQIVVVVFVRDDSYPWLS